MFLWSMHCVSGDRVKDDQGRHKCRARKFWPKVFHPINEIFLAHLSVDIYTHQASVLYTLFANRY